MDTAIQVCQNIGQGGNEAPKHQCEWCLIEQTRTSLKEGARLGKGAEPTL